MRAFVTDHQIKDLFSINQSPGSTQGFDLNIKCCLLEDINKLGSKEWFKFINSVLENNLF